MKKIKNKKKIFNVILFGLFIIYIIALFKIILFKSIPFLQIFKGYNKSRSINLIPFKSIIQFIDTYKEMGSFRAFANLAGNLIVFMPFGYLVPTLNKRFSRIKSIVIASFGLSLFFEVTQYVLGIGSSDIDDVILNTLGAIAGYSVLTCLRKISSKVVIQNFCIMCITVIFLITGSIVAFREYGVMLNLTKLKEVINGGRDIPKIRADAVGHTMQIRENDIKLEKVSIYNKNKEGKSRDKGERNIDIVFNKSTKVYFERDDYKDNTMTITNIEVNEKKLYTLKKNSMISVWGNKKEGKLFANFIIVYLK
ncbi:hypothetical protein NL50_11280 [Clostridium acetobutylicum]|nr:hypothetical protein NL50_11280 [Clostridium acetobutylicum]